MKGRVITPIPSTLLNGREAQVRSRVVAAKIPLRSCSLPLHRFNKGSLSLPAKLMCSACAFQMLPAEERDFSFTSTNRLNDCPRLPERCPQLSTFLEGLGRKSSVSERVSVAELSTRTWRPMIDKISGKVAYIIVSFAASLELVAQLRSDLGSRCRQRSSRRRAAFHRASLTFCVSQNSVSVSKQRQGCDPYPQAFPSDVVVHPAAALGSGLICFINRFNERARLPE